MFTKACLLITSCASVACILAASAMGKDSFAGKYEGAKLSVEVVRQGEEYAGTIHLGDQAFPLTAREQNGQLVGTFRTQGDSFAFAASLQNNSLTLVSGGATYALTKLAPTNPLGKGSHFAETG